MSSSSRRRRRTATRSSGADQIGDGGALVLFPGGAGTGMGERAGRGRTGGRPDPAERAGGPAPGAPGEGDPAASSMTGRRSGARVAGERSPVEGAPTGHSPAWGERDPAAVAREVCLRLLTIAPRTRAELAGTLRRRGFPDVTVDAVLGRFGEVGLIDDEAFARAWVQSRHLGRGLARRALAAELRRRGVEEPTLRAAVETLDPEQELATARELVERRLAAMSHLDPVSRGRRLLSYLARRGYPAEVAYPVVREALAGAGGEESGGEFIAESFGPPDVDLETDPSDFEP